MAITIFFGDSIKMQWIHFPEHLFLWLLPKARVTKHFGSSVGYSSVDSLDCCTYNYGGMFTPIIVITVWAHLDRRLKMSTGRKKVCCAQPHCTSPYRQTAVILTCWPAYMHAQAFTRTYRFNHKNVFRKLKLHPVTFASLSPSLFET